MRRAASAVPATVSGVGRAHSTAREFDPQPRLHRQFAMYKRLPSNYTSRFGGRLSRLRTGVQARGPGNFAKKVPDWKKDEPLRRYNIDVWWAQETLRREWKGRDFDVYELPFALAPAALRRVIPQRYTEPFVPRDAARGDLRDVTEATFPVEELQAALFPGATPPYPAPLARKPTDLAIDRFFEA